MRQQSRVSVANFCATTIIHSAVSPSNIFTQVKDNGHPNKAVRLRLCPVGGNWDSDAFCRSPLELVFMENTQEISFKKDEFGPPGNGQVKVVPDASEISILGLGRRVFSSSLTSRDTASAEDKQKLVLIVAAIQANTRPWGVYKNSFTTEAIRAVDPSSTRQGFEVVSCNYTSGLPTPAWNMLVELWRKYGNLLNEGYSVVTSYEEIMDNNAQAAFAHGPFFADYFASCGFHGSGNLVQLHTKSSVWGPVPDTFEQLLRTFDPQKKPDNWQALVSR